jgi:guanylate kinase
VKEGGFVEHAFVHGNYYGVPSGPLNASLESGTNVILNIDVQGMESVVRIFQDRVVSIFIKPPNRETWIQRLRSRGSDSEDTIQLRIENGLEELDMADRFRYTIINDDLDRAVNEIIDILRMEGVIRSSGSESNG